MQRARLAAARKPQVATTFDFGFALGIMTVFWMTGTIKFAEIFPRIPEFANTAWWFAGSYWHAVDLACALLFVGAILSLYGLYQWFQSFGVHDRFAGIGARSAAACPFPDIADHIIHTISVRFKTTHRRATDIAVGIQVFDREDALIIVRLRLALCVNRLWQSCRAAARGIFEFGLAGQPVPPGRAGHHVRGEVCGLDHDVDRALVHGVAGEDVVVERAERVQVRALIDRLAAPRAYIASVVRPLKGRVFACGGGATDQERAVVAEFRMLRQHGAVRGTRGGEPAAGQAADRRFRGDVGADGSAGNRDPDKPHWPLGRHDGQIGRAHV